MKYLILDVQLHSEAQTVLEDMGFGLLSTKEMSQALPMWSGWKEFSPNNTLLVFVGNGGSKVRDEMPAGWLGQWPWKVNAFAKRFWQPGESPFCIAHSFATGVYIGITDVVVIDDVVSSGVTAKRVRDINLPWIPNSRWNLVTLVAQRAAITRHYVSRYSVAEVGSEQRKVPLNSISTLIADPSMARQYAERNCGERAEDFLRFLSGVRNNLYPVPLYA